MALIHQKSSVLEKNIQKVLTELKELEAAGR